MKSDTKLCRMDSGSEPVFRMLGDKIKRQLEPVAGSILLTRFAVFAVRWPASSRRSSSSLSCHTGRHTLQIDPC